MLQSPVTAAPGECVAELHAGTGAAMIADEPLAAAAIELSAAGAALAGKLEFARRESRCSRSW